MIKRTTYFLLILIFIGNSAYGQLTYNNPILAGFYPDPSICRVGDDYYIVNSSFAYFPGLPIFHSTDLVNWKQIGSAMNRNTQLQLGDAGVSRGLFAPTLRYHDGLYYIMCTNVSKGGNFIITAKDPAGPWSDPVFTPDASGIDPSLFFDDNGKVYITYNSEAPGNKPLYDGHRTIRIIEYDMDHKRTIGDNKIIVNGGTDLKEKPVWIEGPHLYKINGWYYLMCAQGGTGFNHTEVIFRSKKVKGPYNSYKHNPILSQMNLHQDRKNPITSTGHADLVETPNGKWYAVFLGCRPYKDDYYNTGRETFLLPVTFKDGWPVILAANKAVPYTCPVPRGSITQVDNPYSGNFHFKDDFKTARLNDRYLFLRNPTTDLYKLHNGHLILPLKATTASGKSNPAFIGFRQAHLKGYGAVSLDFTAKKENEKAGLMIFQSEYSFYFLCKSIKNGHPVVELYQSGNDSQPEPRLLAAASLSLESALKLKIVADGAKYSFLYATGGSDWQTLKAEVDGKLLSTKAAGGFVGSLYTMYGTSNGIETTNKAVYNWFEYKGNDDAYKQ